MEEEDSRGIVTDNLLMDMSDSDLADDEGASSACPTPPLPQTSPLPKTPPLPHAPPVPQTPPPVTYTSGHLSPPPESFRWIADWKGEYEADKEKWGIIKEENMKELGKLDKGHVKDTSSKVKGMWVPKYNRKTQQPLQPSSPSSQTLPSKPHQPIPHAHSSPLPQCKLGMVSPPPSWESFCH